MPGNPCHCHQREDDLVCQQPFCGGHRGACGAGGVFLEEHLFVLWDLSGLFCGDICVLPAQCAAGWVGVFQRSRGKVKITDKRKGLGATADGCSA